jgi:hypothetical protein
MLILTFNSLEAAFPVRYPRATCPTANMMFLPTLNGNLTYKLSLRS